MMTRNYDPRPKQPHVALWWAIIILLGLFGIFFFVVSLSDLFTGEYVGGRPDYGAQPSPDGKVKDTTLGIVLSLTVACGVIPLAIVTWIFLNLTKKKKKHKEELDNWLETNILRFAAFQKGKITAEETAMEFAIGVARAKIILENMILKNIAELRVSENGVLVYEIRGLNENKENSEKI